VSLPPFRTVCRIVALALLCHTGVDLISVTLCAVDAERFGFRNAARADLAAAPSDSGTDDDGSPPARPRHVDDCFCCSACVDAEPLARPLIVALVAPAEKEWLAPRVPLLSTFLFRPPQLLS